MINIRSLLERVKKQWLDAPLIYRCRLLGQRIFIFQTLNVINISLKVWRYQKISNYKMLEGLDTNLFGNRNEKIEVNIIS